LAKKKSKHTAIRKQTHLNKYREVRDVYNNLRKRYTLAVVHNFFYVNYWLQVRGVEYALSRVDNKPVDPSLASIVYTTVMKDDFYIL